MLQPETTPAPPLIVRQTYDAQQRIEFIQKASLESSITGAQQGPWEMLGVSTPAASLMLFSEGADNVQLSQMASDHCAFLFNLGGNVVLNGEPVSPHKLVLLGPNAESCSRLTAGIQWGGFTLSMGAMQQYLELFEICQPVRLAGTLRPPMHVIMRLGEVVAATRAAACAPTAMNSWAARISLEETLVGTFMSALAHPAGPPRAGTVIYRRVFARAVDYLRAHPEAVSVPELCGALGVSARSLFYAFQALVGITPARYVRLRRLHLVRRRLLSDARCTVAEAATQFGFFELGRFAAQYRALFGEPPAQTLRKSQSP